MSDDNITSFRKERAIRERDNRLWTPVECLEDAIACIKSGSHPATSLLVLRLVEDNNCFDVGYNCCNVNSSKALAMLEIAKAIILKDMGYMS